MKISAMSLLAITTFLLVILVVMVTLDISFGWIFLLTVVGQTLLVLTVYKVLKDDYTTDKTFEDFYEDLPKGRDE